MIVCVNTYRVKPGLRNELVKEITGKNIPQELHALQGNLYFNFSPNIKFTKDQEIAVHELIEFLAQPWDDKKFINALCDVVFLQFPHIAFR